MTIAKVEKRQSAPFHFEVGFIYGYTDMFICLQGLININGAKWAYIACALFLLVEMQEGHSSKILIRLQSGVQVLYDPLLRPSIAQTFIAVTLENLVFQEQECARCWYSSFSSKGN